MQTMDPNEPNAGGAPPELDEYEQFLRDNEEAGENPMEHDGEGSTSQAAGEAAAGEAARRAEYEAARADLAFCLGRLHSSTVSRHDDGTIRAGAARTRAVGAALKRSLLAYAALDSTSVAGREAAKEQLAFAEAIASGVARRGASCTAWAPSSAAATPHWRAAC